LDSENQKDYNLIKDNFLNDTGRTEDSLPPIYFLKDQIPYTKLPSLYKGADAFVLATHGEGWGLPIIEAMAMQLPVIATNWSGNTEFMRESNSYLVPVASMVKATTPGHQWAQISNEDRKLSMRTVFENRREAIQIGKTARQDVLSRYSSDKVAQKVLEKLIAIIQTKDELIKKKDEKKQELARKKAK